MPNKYFEQSKQISNFNNNCYYKFLNSICKKK